MPLFATAIAAPLAVLAQATLPAYNCPSILR